MTYLTLVKTAIDIEPLKKEYLKQRWLDQVRWMENRSGQMRNWHQRLRGMMIVASALVPLMVVIDVNTLAGNNEHYREILELFLKLFIASLGVVVTIGTAIDEFFNFGDRWYSYRKSVEMLKTHGWQFLQLSGMYQEYSDHNQAFPVFVAQIEG
jgi:hypothetical protein